MEKKKFYYGWIVVIAAFLTQFVTTGLLIYTFSLFVAPMATSLDVPRTSITIASSIYTLAFAILSPVAGSQIDKGRIKIMIVIAAVLFGGGFILLAFASNIVMFYIFYALIGIGGALAGPAVGSTLSALWFDKHRGLTTGIVNAAGGVAALFMPTILASVMESSGGTMVAFIIIGIISVVLLLISAVLVKTRPQDIGLMPDGLTKAEYDKLPQKQRPVMVGLTRAQALKTPALWFMAIALMCLGFGQLGVMQNATAFLTDTKFDMVAAAQALSIVGVVGVVSKLFFGWLVDKVDPKIVFAIGNILLIIGTLILTYTQPTSGIAWMYGYAVIFGFGVGCWAPVVPVLAGRTFGMAYFGAIWGVAFGLRTIGDIVGVPGVSGIASFMGYQGAFWIAAILLAISLVLMVFVRKPKSFADIEKAAADAAAAADDVAGEVKAEEAAA
ncbi:MAG: MFS transporter [Coriobacteriales bacterium]|nr:MFS transporter [Coriobacteriales bacterium]